METEYALRVVTSSKLNKVAVVGASGYVGEELVRLLLGHPEAELVAVTSRQFAGQTLDQVFPRFANRERAAELRFSELDPEKLSEIAGTIFLALPHGLSAELAKAFLASGARVVDLSADFRIRQAKIYKEFYGADHPVPDLLGRAIYGLPEVYRKEITAAELVACPGCYPTSILLPVMPLIRQDLIDANRILVTSLSGVTGAGRKIETDYLFAECNESMRPYGVPKHRHLSEIEQELSVAAGKQITIQFTPHLVPVNRGIVSTIYLELRKGADAVSIESVYRNTYQGEPFVRLLGDSRLPDTKNVIGTNFIDIGWRIDPRTGRLVVMSAIDNLIKGASGQAVQCFNLISGLPETSGLL